MPRTKILAAIFAKPNAQSQTATPPALMSSFYESNKMKIKNYKQI